MTKRFKNVKREIWQNGEWWCSANGEHCADVIATALNDLTEENEQLKEEVEYWKGLLEGYLDLQDENNQLKQRNNRQAEQLDRLFNLIEQKDWGSLYDILDDIKRCDEQLEREWGTYGDEE